MTTYYYKGEEISHTRFLALCRAAGVNAGKRSHIEQLRWMAENGHERAIGLLADIKIEKA